MKIGINAPGYLREGLDNYIFHLVRSLAKVDQKNRYVLYCESQPFSELLPFLGKNWTVKALKPRKIWIQFGIPISCAFDRPDVFLFYTPFVPLLYRLYRPSKVVVVVHDIAFQHLKLYSPLRLKFMSIMIGFAVSIADKIIAVSQATKDDIVKFYNVDPSNIEVVHSGYDEDYAKDVAGDKITFVKRKYSIESRYILFVGTIKERKNVKRLIEAYHLLRREFKVNHKLVIGGRKNGNHYKEIVSRLAALKLGSEVIFTDYIPKIDLIPLMKGADVFVFPSLYEGFGLPVLDAMVAGIPVVASDTSSLPEVIGDAGILVNPFDPSVISHAIFSILSNENLRKHLIQRGFERVKRFSWEKTAQETLKVLTSVA